MTTKSTLVKIGVPSVQAEGVRFARRVREILEQHDAAVARLDSAMKEKIREMTADDVADEEPPAAVNE